MKRFVQIPSDNIITNAISLSRFIGSANAMDYDVLDVGFIVTELLFSHSVVQ
jgi:hypothetical protein